MKKFTFTLQKVMDFKNQNLDLHIGELHNLMAQLGKIEDEIKEVELEYKERTEKIDHEMTEGMTIQKLAIHKSYISLLLKRGTELKIKKLNFEAVIEKKKEDIVAIKTEISGLEKLKEKQLFEYNKQSQKMFQLDIEEYVVRKSN